MRRATLLAIGVAAAALSWSACSRPATSDRPKLVILGFDGLDPDLLDEFMKRRRDARVLASDQERRAHELETTVSPESPTAWASFATGVNPGKHNIYDFLVRDTKTYVPDLGMVPRSSRRRFSSTGFRSRGRR